MTDRELMKAIENYLINYPDKNHWHTSQEISDAFGLDSSACAAVYLMRLHENRVISRSRNEKHRAGRGGQRAVYNAHADFYRREKDNWEVKIDENGKLYWNQYDPAAEDRS